MSARSLLERLRWRCQARSDAHLAREIGMTASEVCRILSDTAGHRGGAMRLSTLNCIAAHVELPIGTLAEWWAEPDAEGLRAASESAELGIP